MLSNWPDSHHHNICKFHSERQREREWVRKNCGFECVILLILATTKNEPFVSVWIHYDEISIRTQNNPANDNDNIIISTATIAQSNKQKNRTKKKTASFIRPLQYASHCICTTIFLNINSGAYTQCFYIRIIRYSNLIHANMRRVSFTWMRHIAKRGNHTKTTTQRTANDHSHQIVL